MTDIGRRIERLERRLQPEQPPLHVIELPAYHGEPMEARRGCETVAKSAPGESLAAFCARVRGPGDPVPLVARMQFDSGPMARMEGGKYV